MITLDQLSFGYFKWAEALTNVSARIGSGIHLLLGENGATSRQTPSTYRRSRFFRT